MQKNYSRGEAYARGYFHHIKGHLTAGAIIAIVMFVLHLLSGCEPMLPDESNRETVASPLDSTKNDLDINEWETDTTTYQSHAKPKLLLLSMKRDV